MNNTSVYLHKYNNVSHSTGIPLTKKMFVVVCFNEESTVHHEQPNPDKSPLSPYCQCIWYTSAFGNYGMGIGELNAVENTFNNARMV